MKTLSRQQKPKTPRRRPPAEYSSVFLAPPDIGPRLKTIRALKKIKLMDIAEKTQFSEMHINRMERGVCRNLAALVVFADGLGVKLKVNVSLDTDDLIPVQTEPEPPTTEE